MLPLTSENVGAVFRTGVLTKVLHGYFALTFGRELGISESIEDPLSAAACWVREGEDRRWKVIIYHLDWVGETEIADELMPYSEPPSGV